MRYPATITQRLRNRDPTKFSIARAIGPMECRSVTEDSSSYDVETVSLALRVLFVTPRKSAFGISNKTSSASDNNRV